MRIPNSSSDFTNIYSQGFIRVAAVSSKVHLANPEKNAQEIITTAQELVNDGVALAVFQEMSLSGYSLGELLHQPVLHDACERALADVLLASRGSPIVLVLGMPLAINGELFNVGVVIKSGRLLGVVPKTYLPNSNEFYEKRYFSSWAGRAPQAINLANQKVTVHNDLIFEASDDIEFSFGVEICEDLWSNYSRSSRLAALGAQLVVNLSASSAGLGKRQDRLSLIVAESSRSNLGYVFAASGAGEDTSDVAWDGHCVIAQSGQVLAESERFVHQSSFIASDIDLFSLRHERQVSGTFHDASRLAIGSATGTQVDTSSGTNLCTQPIREKFSLSRADFAYCNSVSQLLRPLAKQPLFNQGQFAELGAIYQEAMSIQVAGLIGRIEASGISRLVLGLSGGLDSCLAALVVTQALRELGRSQNNLILVTMPGPATGSASLTRARDLASALGAQMREISIVDLTQGLLAEIGHASADGLDLHDITYENAQAGTRANILFRLANLKHAMVIGTSDLSEIALGWSTYGVGDHMSHYNVNAGVPKTLVKEIIRYLADADSTSASLREVLLAVSEADITPELIPEVDGRAQKTEDAIGPYELHDFFLYWIVAKGSSPIRAVYLARQLWDDIYSDAELLKWVRVFVQRFFAGSQFKRHVAASGPKVLPELDLSPRGSWRAPPDGQAHVWLAELDKIEFENGLESESGFAMSREDLDD